MSKSQDKQRKQYDLRYRNPDFDIVIGNNAFSRSNKIQRTPPSSPVPAIITQDIASALPSEEPPQDRPALPPPNPPLASPLSSILFPTGTVKNTILKNPLIVTNVTLPCTTVISTTSSRPICSSTFSTCSKYGPILPTNIPFDRDDSRFFESSTAGISSSDPTKTFQYPISANNSINIQNSNNISTTTSTSMNKQGSLPPRRNVTLNLPPNQFNSQFRCPDPRPIDTDCTISTISAIKNPLFPKFLAPRGFDPNVDDPIDFLRQYDIAAKSNSWDNNVKLCYFANFLTGSALSWYTAFAKRFPNSTCDELLTDFKIKCIGPAYHDDLELRLILSRQRPDEPLRDFFYNTLALCYDVDLNMSEETIMRRLVNGLLPYYRHMINISRPQTLHDLESIINSISEAEFGKNNFACPSIPSYPQRGGPSQFIKSNTMRFEHIVKDVIESLKTEID